jgi:SAM-dependent methyltransferase
MSENFRKRDICPVCESGNTEIILSVSFADERIWSYLNAFFGGRVPKEMVKDDQYAVVRCTSCGLVYQENILNDCNMNLLYEEWISPEESLQKKKSADIKLFTRYAREIENISLALGKKPSDTNVLEYGSGWGYWSNLAQAFGFEVTGVELSKTRQDFCRKKGLRIIEDISRENIESYDYIYSNQVFEHLASPGAVIKELGKLLRKNGILHIQVPSAKGILKKLQSSQWRAQSDAIAPLDHINCFDHRSLRALADQAGLMLSRTLRRPKPSSILSSIRNHVPIAETIFSSCNEAFLFKI